MEPLLALACLGLAAARLTGMLAMPAARRELREHPRLAAGLALAALVALVTLGWAARSGAWAWRTITLLVVVGWVFFTLRARATYGRRRGYPPGSIGLRPSLQAIVDPDFYTQAARRHGAVFKMAQFHRPVACVVGIEKGRDLLRRYDDVLRPPPLPLSAEVPRGFLRYMSPQDHARYSRLFRAAISEAALRAIEPFAVAETARALADLAAESQRAPTAGVSPHDAVDRALHTILLRLYFGGLLQPGDEAVIAACGHDADSQNAIGRATPQAKHALRRFEQLLLTRAAAYDAANDPSIWGGLVRLETSTARDPTVAGNLFILLQASQHSIGGMLKWMMVMLGSASAWRDQIRLGHGADDDPYSRAVLETLRLAQSEYVYREVLQPIAIDGFTIPKGWLLRICVAESHRLESVFEHPARFDPERHVARHFTADELSPFGLDQHACMGARMSLLLGRILARQLVHDYDWRVVDDGPRERGNRHWHHWEPSPRFRVVLRHRAEQPS